MSDKKKILYAAGPGNVIETFGYWSQGQDDPSQVSMTFSGQFYDVCSALGAEGYIIASHPDKKSLKDGLFTLEHRPIPLSRQSGALYILGQILYELGLVFSAVKSQSNVVLAGDAQYFFVLSLLPKLGIQVIPALHCVLWPIYIPPSKAKQALWKLNSGFFAKDCLAILSTSEEINDQVKQITHNQPRPIVNFLSTYRRTEFEHTTPASRESSIFQVLFAGRIETDKGVFDLLEIAKRFKAEGIHDVVFNLCGNGSALKSLQNQVDASEMTSSFILHGYCNKPKMQQMFNLSHVVIVPTKSDFVEGLNQVVIEGVLADRPVITSSICPALSYVRAAVVEVPPDDVRAYGDAILKLRDDRAFYEEKRQSCKGLQEQFYSPARSWSHALKSILTDL